MIHRDIKPENILIDEKGNIKLADFGWATQCNNRNQVHYSFCGTPEFMAPEMIKREGHFPNIDFWSLGVLIFEILTGKPPFEGISKKDIYDNVLAKKMKFPYFFPKQAKDLVEKLLEPNIEKRLTIDQIISHPWLKFKNSLIRKANFNLSLPEMIQIPQKLKAL